MDGRSDGIRGKLASRCMLVESEQGLVLFDTGYGLRDCVEPRARLSGFFLRLLAPELRESLTAVRQIEALGFAARDVRHIVLTHLDFDHAGGLDDFPEARVHVLSSEITDAVKQSTWLDRQRFRPQQWSSHARWSPVGPQVTGETWFGFDAVRDIPGLPPEILMVPLRGHTLGHAGIAVRESARWTLLAGDAYFDAREMNPEKPACTPGLRFYQWMMEKDRDARHQNQARLRELVRGHSDEVKVVCSHDPDEMERDSGRSLDSAPSATASARLVTA